MTRGLVVAYHGATGLDCQPLLDPFLALVKTRYPKCHIIPLVFTGPLHHPGVGFDHCRGLECALAELAERGADPILVQPLHVVAGEEYQALARRLAGLGAKVATRGSVRLGRPLLAGPEAIIATATALAADVSGLYGPSRAVVFMGHGSRRPAQQAYVELARELASRDSRLALATLKAPPESGLAIGSVAANLAAMGIEHAALIPLTFAVGAHARLDMAGDAPGSFASELSLAGIRSQAVLAGLATRTGVLEIWLDHVRRAFEAPEDFVQTIRAVRAS